MQQPDNLFVTRFIICEEADRLICFKHHETFTTKIMALKYPVSKLSLNEIHRLKLRDNMAFFMMNASVLQIVED